MSGILEDALVAAGVALLLMCALGVLVMRTPFDRLHYASAGSWGVVLLTVAVLLKESWSLIGDKALALAFVLVLGGPAIVHATARAGRIHRQGDWNPGREKRP